MHGKSDGDMKKYAFLNGDIITSKLSADEIMKRMRRLDLLRVMTEQNNCKAGISICKKALKAYNKMTGFTGIIKLTCFEKEWLSYKLESDFLSAEKREVIRFYTK